MITGEKLIKELKLKKQSGTGLNCSAFEICAVLQTVFNKSYYFLTKA